MSADARMQEGNERLRLAAYVGWQLGAAGNKTFSEYLHEQELFEESPQTIKPVFDKAATDARLNRMGIKPKKGKYK